MESRLKKALKIELDCLKKRNGIDDVKLFGNKLSDYSKEELNEMSREDLQKIKRLAINKLNNYYAKFELDSCTL